MTGQTQSPWLSAGALPLLTRQHATLMSHHVACALAQMTAARELLQQTTLKLVKQARAQHKAGERAAFPPAVSCLTFLSTFTNPALSYPRWHWTRLLLLTQAGRIGSGCKWMLGDYSWAGAADAGVSTAALVADSTAAASGAPEQAAVPDQAAPRKKTRAVQPGSFMLQLMSARHTGGGEPFDDITVLAQAFTFLLAGQLYLACLTLSVRDGAWLSCYSHIVPPSLHI